MYRHGQSPTPFVFVLNSRGKEYHTRPHPPARVGPFLAEVGKLFRGVERTQELTSSVSQRLLGQVRGHETFSFLELGRHLLFGPFLVPPMLEISNKQKLPRWTGATEDKLSRQNQPCPWVLVCEAEKAPTFPSPTLFSNKVHSVVWGSFGKPGHPAAGRPNPNQRGTQSCS